MIAIKFKSLEKILSSLVVIALITTACKDPFLNSGFIERTDSNLELSNAEFLKKNSDQYSLWIELLKYANLFNALNDANANSTVFAPDNAAIERFLSWKEVDSVQELDVEYVKNVARTHILKGVLRENEFIVHVENGSIPTKTLFGNYLTTSYGFKDFDVDDEFLEQVVLEDSLSIYLNNQAKVANLGRADTTANGRIYTLHDVIRPLSETILDVLRTYKEYEIFVEAAELTGYDKIVSVYNDTVLNIDGSVSVNDIRFTCYAVPDDVYKSQGISSIQELIDYLQAGSNYQDTSNGLYQYVAYHFANQSYKKAELAFVNDPEEVKIYDTNLAGNVITIQQEHDKLLINNSAYIVRSNIQARNGVIHKVSNIMPVYEPEPLRVVWDFCNYPDIESFVNAYGASKNLGDLFSAPLSNKEYQIDLSEDKQDGNFGTISSLNYIANPGKSSVRSWKKVGFFKTSYLSNAIRDENKYGAYRNDLFILNLGYAGHITMQTPTIIKGKYKVVFYYAGAPGLKTFYAAGSNTKFNLDDYQKSIFMWKGIPATFVDPEKQNNINANGIASDVLWEEVSFENSGTHVFKATMMDINAKTNGSYRQMWDFIEFIPIND